MNGSELIHLLLRWFHVAAAVLWVGQLWSLTLINRWLPGRSTEPALAPVVLRAYNWQRSVSDAVWLTGFALLGIVYYGGGALTTVDQSPRLAMGAGLAALPIGWILYDGTWTFLSRIPAAAAALSLALLTAVGAGLSRVMTGRAMFIHLGAMLGTIMVVNVQQRVWPIQRRLLGGAGSATPPAEHLLETARIRMEHNAGLAVAIVLFMVSNHFPLLYGQSRAWLHAPAIVLMGFLVTYRRNRQYFANFTS